MSLRSLPVPDGLAGERVDAGLSRLLGLSRTRAAELAADGAVRLEPGGTGAVRLHARALGPWFSGAQNTHALRRAGLLEGDPADAVVLDQLVGSAGTPRLADFF